MACFCLIIYTCNEFKVDIQVPKAEYDQVDNGDPFQKEEILLSGHPFFHRMKHAPFKSIANEFSEILKELKKDEEVY